MFQKFEFLLRYIKYFTISKHYGGHGIHSPFLFSFLKKVFFVKKDPSDYSKIYKYIKFLKRSKILVKTDDYGAGSKAGNSAEWTISSIARNASTRRKYGRILARMVAYFRPACIIELGTSLGASTSYLVLNLMDSSRLYTIEGAKSLLNFAQLNNEYFNTEKIVAINGNFDSALPDLLKQLDTVDLVYLDGNHRKEPTIKYFELLLPKLNNESVLIFDDIHWSEEMEDAWNYIKSHQSVKLSLDFFQIGIIFFRKELLKEDFVIRY